MRGKATEGDWLWETKRKMEEIGCKVKHRIELNRKQLNEEKK